MERNLYLAILLLIFVLFIGCNPESGNQFYDPDAGLNYDVIEFTTQSIKSSHTLTVPYYNLKSTESYVNCYSEDSDIVSVSMWENKIHLNAKNIGSTRVLLKSNLGRVIAIWPIVVSIYSINLSIDYADLDYGDAWQLTVTTSPSNIPAEELMFVSSNESAVSVSNEGLIEVIGYGNSIITVFHDSDNTIIDSCRVRVTGYPDSFARGSGTIIDPYIIETPGQLAKMAEYLGANFQLGSDIDLSGYSAGTGWIPIGTGENPFTGKLDGNGYKISNLVLNYLGGNTIIRTGLFGYMSAAEITNLELVGGEINSVYRVGFIAGETANSCLISGVKISGNINYEEENDEPSSIYNWVGGIVGFNVNSRIENCSFSGNIDATSQAWDANIGGIVGKDFSSTIVNSNVIDSTIWNRVMGGGRIAIGGIVGYTHSPTIIDNCTVEADISGFYNVGGIIGDGDSSSLSISNSWFDGSLRGQYKVGGIIGSLYNGSVSNTYANTSIAIIMHSTSYYNYGYIGGVVGKSYRATVSNSWATMGSLSNSSEKVGGFVGGIDADSVIEDCYSLADVSGTDYIGGFAGESLGTIRNSYSSATVSARTTNVGGFIGKNSGTIESSYYDSEVSEFTDSSKGSPLTTVDMKKQSSFEGWNFVNTWDIDEGVTYPYLR